MKFVLSVNYDPLLKDNYKPLTLAFIADVYLNLNNSADVEIVCYNFFIRVDFGDCFFKIFQGINDNLHLYFYVKDVDKTHPCDMYYLPIGDLTSRMEKVLYDYKFAYNLTDDK
jgi:hypothetical protein